MTLSLLGVSLTMEGSPYHRIFEFTSACLWRGFGGNRLGLAIHPVHPVVVFLRTFLPQRNANSPETGAYRLFLSETQTKPLTTPSKNGTLSAWGSRCSVRKTAKSVQPSYCAGGPRGAGN